MKTTRALLRQMAERWLAALKSRQVIIAISAVVVSLLVMAVPTLETVRGELLTLVITFALVIISGYNMQDAARHARESNGASTTELRDLVKELLVELIEELTDADEEAQAPEERANA